MQRFRGFSLIELLIVLVIISITIGFAVAIFGDFGQTRGLKMSAQQLQRVLRFVRETAVLEAENFVLVVDTKGYHLRETTFSPELTRVTTGTFPSGGRVAFQPSAQSVMIELHSSGTMTPFELYLGNTKVPRLVKLVGRENGQMVLSAP